MTTTDRDDPLVERLLAAVARDAPDVDTEHAAQVIRVVLGELEAIQDQAEADAEAYAADVLARTGFKGMDIEPGEVTLRLAPPHDLVVAMAEALAEHLRTAENYTETPFTMPPAGPDGGPPDGAPSVSMDVHAAGDPEGYVLTVQRMWKRTPHQLRREAEAERDQLRTALKEAHRTIQSLTAGTQ